MISGCDSQRILAILEDQSDYIVYSVYGLVNPVTLELVHEFGPFVIYVHLLLR